MSLKFLHLLTIATLFQSMSCEISCYDCSGEHDVYDYMVTADHIPEQLNNCLIKTNRDMCYITVQWIFGVNVTHINVGGESRKTELSSTQDLLVVDVALSGVEPAQEIQHRMNYYCSTDKCNNVTVFKRILHTLMIGNQFNDIKDLLKPVPSFDGRWCLFFSNATASDCTIPPVADPSTCKQCSAEYFDDGMRMTNLCASCHTDKVQTQSIICEAQFNMTARTSAAISYINCQSQNCNSVQTGDLIRQKTTIHFSFETFFDSGSPSLAFASFDKIVFMLIVLGINYCFK